jgi:hypothetical protein
MTKDEFEDAKTLWKLVYAGACFKDVENACSFIIDQKIDSDHPIYHSLIASIYVVYGKPFKQSRIIGKLPDNIVPAKHRELHDNLLKHRDQLYAHADAKSFQVPDLGEANQVRFVVASGRMQLFSRRFAAGLLLLPDIGDLCRSLRKKIDYHIMKLGKRHIKKVPTSIGEYTLNILDESGPFVKKETPTISISSRAILSRRVVHSL